jgi:hypothetical protein
MPTTERRSGQARRVRGQAGAHAAGLDVPHSAAKEERKGCGTRAGGRLPHRGLSGAKFLHTFWRDTGVTNSSNQVLADSRD